MTDREILCALRRLKVETGSLVCFRCGREHSCGVYGCAIIRKTADRLEELLHENATLRKEIVRLEERYGHFRDHTEMTIQKWISVEERLPHFNQPYIVTACDEDAPAGEGIWHGTAVVVAEYYNGRWTWEEGETEYDLTGLVTHWMPMPNASEPTGTNLRPILRKEHYQMETNYRRQEGAMKTAEIIRELRCAVTKHVDGEPECSICPYFVKEPLPPNEIGKLPEGFYWHCVMDKICIDAAERLESIRDGRWISVQEDDTTEGLWQCSECGGEFFLPEGCPTEYGYNFCPNCGARLDSRGVDNGEAAD